MISLYNESQIKKFSEKELFLLDSSAFQIFEEWGVALEFNLLEKIQLSQSHHFFITNEVLVELCQKRPKDFMNTLFGYTLNAEGSMSHNVKHSSFPIKVNGEMVVINTNAISAEDFSQIWLCGNHPELTLISNDRKLLKTGAIVLQGRVTGPSTFIKRFIQKYPEDPDLNKLSSIIKNLKEKEIH